VQPIVIAGNDEYGGNGRYRDTDDHTAENEVDGPSPGRLRQGESYEESRQGPDERRHGSGILRQGDDRYSCQNGQYRTQGGTGGHAGDVGVHQGVAYQSLHDHAGHRETDAHAHDRHAADHPRPHDLLLSITAHGSEVGDDVGHAVDDLRNIDIDRTH